MSEKFGFNPDQTFTVPQEVYDLYGKHSSEGAAAEEEWNKLFAKYKESYPKEHADLSRRLIAYDSDASGDWEVYLTTGDGGVTHNVTNHPSVDSLIGWSRDGESLLIRTSRSGEFRELALDLSGQVFNVGTGIQSTLKQLVDAIIIETKSSSKIVVGAY
ncbi:MAG: hypothetical protein AAB393_14480, partial [Bacteroidota bacterium]